MNINTLLKELARLNIEAVIITINPVTQEIMCNSNTDDTENIILQAAQCIEENYLAQNN